MGTVIPLPTRGRSNMADQLRSIADDMDTGRISAELIAVVIQHQDGNVTTDFFGRTGFTNAHAYGVLGIAARNFIMADN